jgi:hypothetical protein
MTPPETTPKVYYLAGPMNGYPEHNHPAFHKAAAELRACGHTIISPAEYGQLVTGWQTVMKRDIHALLWCDAVIVMPGWEKSRGARLETRIAWDLEMLIYPLDVLLCDCIRFSDASNPVWHTESCYGRRITISMIPADDLSTVAMYSRTYGDGEVHAAAARVLHQLGRIAALTPGAVPSWPEWFPRGAGAY